MLRDVAVALIKQQLGMRQTLATEIIMNLQFAQTTLELAPTKPWFMIGERASVLTTANEERVPVPSNFVLEVDDEGLTYVPDDADEVPVPLKKDNYDVNQVNFKNTDPGKPKAYSLVGAYFRLFPVPDAAYTIRMIQYQNEPTLDTNIENGWLKYVPHLLMGTALNQIASAVRDQTAMSMAQSWISAGVNILHKHDVAREMANSDLQMGGPHR